MMVYSCVNKYYKSLPDQTRLVLRKLRSAIVENIPDVKEEFISGTFIYKNKEKVIIYFFVENEFIKIYFTPVKYTEYPTEITEHQKSEDFIRLKIDRPFPYNLIGQMINNKVRQHNQKALV